MPSWDPNQQEVTQSYLSAPSSYPSGQAVPGYSPAAVPPAGASPHAHMPPSSFSGASPPAAAAYQAPPPSTACISTTLTTLPLKDSNGEDNISKGNNKKEWAKTSFSTSLSARALSLLPLQVIVFNFR
ncbi:polypyrimidine tract-binding-like protein [Trifolium medium]|uniref:Polypyrimidine tract-binding-like protein n=1 Tax=Trifolium medium TaxID=97028 RepID=A0A392ND08_9FABA|nr:polypyrimidine tract-binding-like protein [Trifolium medium]